MGLARREYWSGQAFLFPGDLPNPGIEPRSPTLQADSLPSEPQCKPPEATLTSWIIYLSVQWFNRHKREHTQCAINYWNEELLAGLLLLIQAFTLGMGILHASTSQCIHQFFATVCALVPKERSPLLQDVFPTSKKVETGSHCFMPVMGK